MANGYRVEKWNRPYSPNPAMLRMEMESEGFRVMSWCDMPEATYGMHRHETEQSHWVISGRIEITVGNIPYVLSAGDRDRMPANTFHTARVIGEEPVTYLIGERTVSAETGSQKQDSELLIDNMILMEKMIAAAQAEEGAAAANDVASDDAADDKKSRDE